MAGTALMFPHGSMPVTMATHTSIEFTNFASIKVRFENDTARPAHECYSMKKVVMPTLPVYAAERERTARPARFVAGTIISEPGTATHR